MDRVFGPIGREQQDQPLDLPPAAEMGNIAKVATPIGARRRLAGGKVAETRDQLRGLGRGCAVGQMDVIFQRFPLILLFAWSSRRAFPNDRPASSTRRKPRRLCWRAGAADAMGGAMSSKKPRAKHAGGILIAFAVVAGAVAGLFMKQTSLGMVGGMAVGLLLAGLVWWLDRR